MSSGLALIFSVRLLMVGSSPSATWGEAPLLAGVLDGVGLGVGVATTTWVGVGLGLGVAMMAWVGVGAGVGGATTIGVGVGAGVGVNVVTGSVLAWLPPPAPGMKEKSSASEDDSQGTCSRFEARVTPSLVRFSVSSAERSGTRISFNSSCTKRLWSPPLSEITELNAAEYITSVPFGATTGASP